MEDEHKREWSRGRKGKERNWDRGRETRGTQQAEKQRTWEHAFQALTSGILGRMALHWWVIYPRLSLHQFSSLQSLSHVQLCNPMECSTPGLPVHHQLPEFTQTLVHWVSDAIQPSHPLSSPSPPTFNFSQHQGLFKWVSSLHQVVKVLEFQLQHQSFQWIFRTDFL